MGIKRSRPGDGAQNRRTHFRYAGCAPGTKWTARIAGPYWGGQCHCSERTKPCLSWITDDALPCPRCTPKNPSVWVAYVPLWRDSDGAPVFVIVHEQCSDGLAALEYPMPVAVACNDSRGDSVYLHRVATEREFRPTIPAKRRPANIVPSLLTLWCLPELTQYADANSWVDSSDNALSLESRPGVAVTDAGVVLSPGMQAAGKRWGARLSTAPEDAAAVTAAEQRLLARARARERPSANGTGQHTE